MTTGDNQQATTDDSATSNAPSTEVCNIEHTDRAWYVLYVGTAK